jgi:hypothetical protein
MRTALVNHLLVLPDGPRAVWLAHTRPACEVAEHVALGHDRSPHRPDTRMAVAAALSYFQENGTDRQWWGVPCPPAPCGICGIIGLARTRATGSVCHYQAASETRSSGLGGPLSITPFLTRSGSLMICLCAAWQASGELKGT